MMMTMANRVALPWLCLVLSVPLLSALECNQTNAYVEIKTPKSLEGTLLSAPVSFGATAFDSVPASELVTLAAEDNNGCIDSSSSLVTDVADKIVFIWLGTNCSDESKVLTLEHAGAVAVLIGNDEGEEVVETISDTTNSYRRLRRLGSSSFGQEVPSIPTRLIDEEDAWILLNYISSISGASGGSGLTGPNTTLTAEIGCFRDGYASSVCVSDGTGSFWYVDGEFEQQAKEGDNMIHNLPVFKKEGYFGMSADLFLFASNNTHFDEYVVNRTVARDMESSNSENAEFGYRWVIGWEAKDYVTGTKWVNETVAFCEELNRDPADCTHWMTVTDDFITIRNNKTYQGGFERNNQFWVSDALCEEEQSYVCMESNTYALSGLSGTYQLVTDAMGLWTREPSESDMAPGYLVYGYTWYGSRRQGYVKYYGWFLMDTVDQSVVAYCLRSRHYNKSEEFRPNLCDTWHVIPDSTTHSYVVTANEQLASSGVCSDYSTRDAITYDDTDAGKSHEYVCIGNHTLMHTFLQGEYKLLDDMTTSSGRGVWQFMDGSSHYDAYIFYYGDLDDDVIWWVISNDPPTSNSPRIFAYCPAMTEHPSDCKACWFFYFNGKWDPDCEVYVNRGLCNETNTVTSAPSSKPTASSGGSTGAPVSPPATYSTTKVPRNSAAPTVATGAIATTPAPTTISVTAAAIGGGGSSGSSGSSGSGSKRDSSEEESDEGEEFGSGASIETVLIILGVILLCTIFGVVAFCFFRKRKMVHAVAAVPDDDVDDAAAPAAPVAPVAPVVVTAAVTAGAVMPQGIVPTEDPDVEGAPAGSDKKAFGNMKRAAGGQKYEQLR